MKLTKVEFIVKGERESNRVYQFKSCVPFYVD